MPELIVLMKSASIVNALIHIAPKTTTLGIYRFSSWPRRPPPLRCVAQLIPPGQGILTHSTRPTFYLIRMSHSRNSVRSASHFLRISYSHNSIRPAFHLLMIFHIRRLPPDGRGGRFSFPGHTCSDPLVAPTRTTFAAGNLDSPDSLAHQILAIRRIHFRTQ